MGKLTTKTVAGKLKPGMHNDGAGLYLRVSPSNARSWILRCRVRGAKRDIGLGGTSVVSLAEARKKAAAMRAIARSGGDPIAERDRAQHMPTFEEAAQTVWQEQIVPTARNEKHKAQWINTLRDYAFPVIGGRRVDVIHSGDILQVLNPIWLDKPETARRVRQRLRTVFDWAIAARHREASNPLAGIEKALPKQGDRPKHHAALPYEKLPGLMERLAAMNGVGAMAVRFAILTAARSGEIRGARWSEIDFDAAVWTIPGNRMKAKQAHRVPLTADALALLQQVRGLDEDLIFPSRKPGRPLSHMTLAAVLKRLNVPATVHGMRSTFRDWAEEMTGFPREVKERALAHTVRDKVEAAYRRTDLFEKRRQLMDQWGRFCISASEGGKVVELRA